MNDQLKNALDAMRKAIEICEILGVEFELPEGGGMSINHNDMKSVNVGVYLCARDFDFLDVY